MKAFNFKTNKEKSDYSKENPYAASHPYAKGSKLKPKGAPAPHKALSNMTSHEAIRIWKSTGKKPKGLHKVEIDSVMRKRND